LLRPNGTQCKNETGSENGEPDQPHGHVSVEDWLPGSLAEGHYAHQRPGLDEHRGAGQHALLDHLIRPLQQRLPDREAERRRFGVLDVVGLSTRLLRYFG
jgi:hypothetical protein